VHAAPPVRVTLRRGAGWPLFVGSCAAAAAANTVAWALMRSEVSPVWPYAVAAMALAGTLAAAWARAAAGQGDMAWDGAQWQWQGETGQVRVCIDLGGWVLLRFARASGSRDWIAASRAQTQGPWSAWRAALYARHAADRLAAPPPA
jgi:hypothetical protein